MPEEIATELFFFLAFPLCEKAIWLRHSAMIETLLDELTLQM